VRRSSTNDANDASPSAVTTKGHPTARSAARLLRGDSGEVNLAGQVILTVISGPTRMA
jgi:hypothetical protein